MKFFTIVILSGVLISSFSFGKGQLDGAVARAAAKMKAHDVRTVVSVVNNTDGNPCLPEGKSFQVDLQVKLAAYDRQAGKVIYSWQTAKTINIDKGGKTMEVCAE